MTIRAWIAGLLTFAAISHAAEPGVYETFNTFATKRYGAAAEPLVHATFGKEMKLLADSAWSHVSENSASIAFSTSLPAVTQIEFGEGFAQKTTASERPFYTHLHHVRGLEPGKTYPYRIVATDETGQRTVLREEVLKPQKIDDAIYIPGDLKGPPFVLNKADATYVLTQDIVAPSVAINIMAPGVKVDLNGFTVTYDNVAGADRGPEKGFGHFGEIGPHAVRSSYGGKGSKVLNGSIVQGAGASGDGSQPIYSTSISEIAGINVLYHGSQLSGIHGGGDVHHNVVTDAGTHLTDRHMGIAAIRSSPKVSYNLIKRARQRGISANNNGNYSWNEIYIDSYATNSFGVLVYKQDNVTVANNRIFGTGYHPIGVGAVSAGVSKVKIEKNFIHLEAVAPVNRSSEYGNQSEAECVRVTWGGEDIQFIDNVMVAKAEAGGEVSGIWHYSQVQGQKDVVYRGNTIKVLRSDDRPNDKLEGAIRICGIAKEAGHVPVLIENNTVISDFCNVRLGDGYGVGSNAIFRGNTFIKTGDQKNYVTIQIGHDNNRSNGHLFENNQFKDGAAIDKVRWVGAGERDFTIVDDKGNRTTRTPPAN